ncbi:MAG: ABC transporter ATP-binding protein [Candidatus Omnitrophica bacterium]|nr:ABC transporter ATP-binding protein [Candidatus Omnitrophota bacterium]
MLSVERLSVVYEGRGSSVRAVDEVSFTIEAGEVLALVGESGCGKTSVALALTKLLPMPPATITGRVLFEGKNLMEASPDALRAVRGGKIAYVFQEPATSLNPVLTIREQLVEVIELHTPARGREAQRVAVEWLQRVGIADARERLSAYPHEFSGGMQQRVMLAMAMATRPSLLIADEPTTALDVTIQVQILRLLRDLQRAYRLCVLLISHDLTVVERIAHRVGVMSAGKLVELGPVAQILHQPAHPYTKELIRYRSMMSLPRRNTSHD